MYGSAGARAAGRGVRLVLAAAIVALGMVVAPPAHADTREAAKYPEAAAEIQRAMPYLEQLLAEINVLRGQAGTRPLRLAPIEANAAIGQYLADLTPRMVEQARCFHGDGNPVHPGWDYVASAGIDAPAGGEVLACPDNTGYWTPAKLAERWWRSESHRHTLYADPDASLVACGTFGPLKDGKAYQTIACVTLRS